MSTSTVPSMRADFAFAFGPTIFLMSAVAWAFLAESSPPPPPPEPLSFDDPPPQATSVTAASASTNATIFERGATVIVTAPQADEPRAILRRSIASS